MFHEIVANIKSLPPSLPTWALAAAVSAALALQSYVGLPRQVDTNSAAIQEIQVQLETDSERIQRMLCIIELQIERETAGWPSPLEVSRECGR